MTNEWHQYLVWMSVLPEEFTWFEKIKKDTSLEVGIISKRTPRLNSPLEIKNTQSSFPLATMPIKCWLHHTHPLYSLVLVKAL